MFCPKCGEKNDDNAYRCVKCGAEIQEPVQEVAVQKPSFPWWILAIILPVVLVVFIGIISAIAIPSLLRSRMSANEASAVGSMKTIAAAETDYNNNSSPHTYTGVLYCLGSGNGAGRLAFVDPAISSGIKSGYKISLKVSEPYDSSGSRWAWSATAWPIVYSSTGVRTFFIDETGIIRGSDINGGPGTIDLPSID